MRLRAAHFPSGQTPFRWSLILRPSSYLPGNRRPMRAYRLQCSVAVPPKREGVWRNVIDRSCSAHTADAALLITRGCAALSLRLRCWPRVQRKTTKRVDDDIPARTVALLRLVRPGVGPHWFHQRSRWRTIAAAAAPAEVSRWFRSVA